jgi:hypothetical protein
MQASQAGSLERSIELWQYGNTNKKPFLSDSLRVK